MKKILTRIGTPLLILVLAASFLVSSSALASNPNIISISPAAGTTLSGDTTFSAEVSDPDGIKEVRFYLGGRHIGTKTPAVSKPLRPSTPQFSIASETATTADVRVTWGGASGATSYQYESGLNSGSGWSGASGSTSNTQVTLSSVPKGANIWFCVWGVNTAGNGDKACNSHELPAPTTSFDFSLSNGGNKSVTQGSSVSNTITATLAAGTAQSVSFSVSGLPSGASASWSGTSCTPTCSRTLSISTSASTPTGNRTITVTAAGGGVSKTTSFTLTVNAASFPFSFGANPTSITWGESSVLSWDASQADFCTSGPWTPTESCNFNICNRPVKGSFTVSPGESTTYTLGCTQYQDNEPAISQSRSVTVNVLGDSVTRITNPLNGDTVSGSVFIETEVFAEAGIAKVEFRFNGVLIATDTEAPYTAWHDTRQESNTTHAINARAYDNAGNSLGHTIFVTVNNPTVSPPPPPSDGPEPFISLPSRLFAGASNFIRTAVAQTGEVFSIVYDVSKCDCGTGEVVYRVEAEDVLGNVSLRSVTVLLSGAVDPSSGAVAIASPENEEVVDGTYLFEALVRSSAGLVPQNTEFRIDNQIMTDRCNGIAFAPVCGTNGRTYANQCYAQEAQVSLASQSGACQSNSDALFVVRFNTGNVGQGQRQFSFTAWDGANQAHVATSTFFVDRQNPTGTITSPSGNEWVGGTVQVNASAQDNIAVDRVEFFFNNAKIADDNEAPYQAQINTTAYPDGAYPLSITVFDKVNRSGSHAIQINVDNTPPTVQITAPQNNATVSGDITVQANASDNSSPGVQRVEFFVEGEEGRTLVTTDNIAPWSASIDTTRYPFGTYKVIARAHDRAGNTAESSVSLTFDNRPPNVSLFLSPKTKVAKLRDVFPVDIRLNTDGNNIASIEAHIQFDATKLEVDRVDASNSVFPVEAITQIGSGSVVITRGAPSPQFFNGGNGLVATIYFKAKSLIPPPGTPVNILLTSPGEGPSRVIKECPTSPCSDLLLEVQGSTFIIEVSIGDLNGDGRVDVIDLGILLSNWGWQGAVGANKADFCGGVGGGPNGIVDVIDLGCLLSNWSG